MDENGRVPPEIGRYISLTFSDPGLGLDLLLGVSSMPRNVRSGFRHSLPPKISQAPVKRSSHVMPRSPVIDLNGPGRLRTAHVLALSALSHSTLYSRMKAGTFPAPDGQDGGLNYWTTATIRKYLTAMV